MKVICTRRYPTKEQNLILGNNENNETPYALTIGQEYVVLGVSFQLVTRINKGVIFMLRDDFSRCAFVPACLLEVSDPRLSQYWRAQKIRDFDMFLAPEEFFIEYLIDDLSEGVAESKRIFDHVCTLLEREALQNSSSC